MSRARMILKTFIFLAVLAAVLVFGSQHFMIAVNLTDSIPYRIFWVKKGVLPHKDEWLTFISSSNHVYPRHTKFTKQVKAVSGDSISFKNRELFINGEYITYAKRFSKAGQPLVLGPQGKIPEGYYFALAPHQDSFDSRYQNIGWIHESQILGTAIPLL